MMPNRLIRRRQCGLTLVELLVSIVLMLLVSIGFATGLLGLIVLIPLLGHASWHAYRSLVDASALPERPRG